MAIAFLCENCGREYRVNENLSGKNVTCKSCGSSLQIPTLAREHDSRKLRRGTSRAAKPPQPRKRTRKKAATLESNPNRRHVFLISGGVLAVAVLCGGLIVVVSRMASQLPQTIELPSVQLSAPDPADSFPPDAVAQLIGEYLHQPYEFVAPDYPFSLAQKRLVVILDDRQSESRETRWHSTTLRLPERNRAASPEDVDVVAVCHVRMTMSIKDALQAYGATSDMALALWQNVPDPEPENNNRRRLVASLTLLDAKSNTRILPVDFVFLGPADRSFPSEQVGRFLQGLIDDQKMALFRPLIFAQYENMGCVIGSQNSETEIHLGSTNVQIPLTDPCLRPLYYFKDILRTMSLSQADGVTDDGLRVVSEMTALEDLAISAGESAAGAGISSAGMVHLTGASESLKRLRVSGLSIGDDGVKSLVALGHLEQLSLRDDESITDAALTDLAMLPSLKVLDTFGTGITDDGLESFRRERPDVDVYNGQYLPEGVFYPTDE